MRKTKYFQKRMIKRLKNNNFARNSFILFAGMMSANVLNYVFHLVVGRIVSVQIYGETESLLSLINIISVPATTLVLVAAKYASSCKAEGNKKGSLEIWKYLNKKIIKYGLPLFLVAVIAIPFVGKFLNIHNNFALALIWILMLLSFFSAVNSGMLQGWQKFRYISLANVGAAVVKLVFGIILVKAGFALNGIVGSFLLGSMAAYLVTSLAFKFIVIGNKKEESDEAQCGNAIDFKSLKRYIVPVFAGNLAVAILGNADMVLAKHNLDALTAGQYGALFVVSKIIFFATGIMASVLFSMAAENHHKKENSLKIFRQAFFLMLVAVGAATLAYFIFPGLILGILFGAKYQSVAPFLGWFAVAASLFSVTNLTYLYLLSIRKTKISFWLLAISILMGLLILFHGTTIFAILKIVIAAEIISILIGLYFVRREKYAYQYETDLDYNPGV